MSDIISRQALIDSFKEEFSDMYSDEFNYLIKWFEQLPTAELTYEAVEEYCRRRNLALIYMGD